MKTAAALLMGLCAAAAAAPPDDFTYAGFSRATTGEQLMGRYHHAQFYWHPYDGSMEFYYDAEPGDEKKVRTPKKPSMMTVVAVGEDGSTAPVSDTGNDRFIIADLARTKYGLYTVENKDKDARGVDDVAALMRAGKIEQLTLHVSRPCAAILKELSRYGKPEPQHFEGEEGSGDAYRWRGAKSEMTLTCRSANPVNTVEFQPPSP